MARPDYTPEQRSRNQRTVLLTTMAVLGIVVISGALQNWSLGALLGASVIIGLLATAFWRLFASVDARPFPADGLDIRADLSDVEIGRRLRRTVSDSERKRLLDDELD